MTAVDSVQNFGTQYRVFRQRLTGGQEERTRVGVIHRQAGLAEGLQVLLQQSGEYHAQLLSPGCSAGQLQQLQLQMVVAELCLPDVEMARDLQGTIPVIFLRDDHPVDELVLQLLDLGVFGLAHLSQKDELLRGCASLLKGRSYMAPYPETKVLRALAGLGSQLRLTSLERSLLVTLSEPQPTPLLAEEQQVGVRHHLLRIQQKLKGKYRHHPVQPPKSQDLQGDTANPA